MRIISDDNATADANGEATSGGPGGVPPATTILPDVANSWQREFLQILAAGNITQNKSLNNQLLLAMQAMFMELSYKATITTDIAQAVKELGLANYTTQTTGFGSSRIFTIGHNNQNKLNNSLYIAAGEGGKLETSINGMKWTTRTSGISSSINVVAHSSTLNQWLYGSALGDLYTSTAGITWTTRSLGFSTTTVTGAVYSVTLGLWIVVGGSGKLATSTDGITWTLRTSSFGNNAIYAITENAGVIVVVGVDGRVATSTDGTTWNLMTSGTTATIRAVKNYGTGFIFGDENGDVYTSNSIATTWTFKGNTSLTSIRDIISTNDNMLIAVGEPDILKPSRGISISKNSAVTWNGMKGQFLYDSGAGVSFINAIVIDDDSRAIIVADAGQLSTSMRF